MSTQLVFRTHASGADVPARQSVPVGTASVGSFSKIRVTAGVRASSKGCVRIRLMLKDGEELVGQLDEFVLSRDNALSRVYDVPGTQLVIYAAGIRASDFGCIDLLIYGI